MRLILATLLTLAAFPAAALAAPTVTTGAADPVGQTTATVKGTVDPNGDEATYHFEYGTTTAYGLQTVEQTAGSGDAPVDVQAALGGLSPSTTYHYRLVAGGVAGADATFTTTAPPANPAVPTISLLSTSDRTATTVNLRARIDPNRATTTYAVEWGLTSSLGARTPDQTLPAGDSAVPVSIPLEGLTPFRRVYWRVVATNAAGVSRSGIATFTTRRAPAGIVATVSTARATWGTGVTVSGRVEGEGVNGIRVLLQEGTWPYSSPFAQVAAAHVDSSGDFRFQPRQALIATRWRVVTQSTPSFTSGTLETLVRPRASARARRFTRRRARIVGATNPALPGGVATLQRRTSGGGWALVKRKALAPVDQFRSRVAFTVARRRDRARTFRIAVDPASAGYLRVSTAAVRVARRR